MVEDFNLNKDYLDVLSFIKDKNYEQLSIKENNINLIVDNAFGLKKLINQSSSIRIIKELGDVLGLLCLLKSVNNKKYIKLSAVNSNIGNKLLKVLIWNINDDLYIEIDKFSIFYKILKDNKFNFLSNDGNKFVLKRNKLLEIKKET